MSLCLSGEEWRLFSRRSSDLIRSIRLISKPCDKRGRPAPFANAHAGFRFNRMGLTALAVCIAAVLYLGIRPNGLLDLSRTSGAAVRPAATLSAPRAGN